MSAGLDLDDVAQKLARSTSERIRNKKQHSVHGARSRITLVRARLDRLLLIVFAFSMLFCFFDIANMCKHTHNHIKRIDPISYHRSRGRR